MNEEKLIRKVAEGDEESFREIVRIHRDMVIRICTHLLNDREQAEEAAQDVFLSVFKKAGTFKGESRLSTWIYRIAVHSALGTRRRMSPPWMNRHVREKGEEDPACLKAPWSDSPDSRLESEEMKAAIRKALDSLPEKQRTFIILNKMEGLPVWEIARIFRLTPSAVEGRIHRAKNNLRKKLVRLLSAP